MAQPTADVSQKYKVDNQDVRCEQSVDAATTIYAGAFVSLNASTSLAHQLVGGEPFLGIADAQAANVANPTYPNLSTNGLLLGAAGALNVDLRAEGVIVLPAASIAGSTGAANITQDVYASDGATLTLNAVTVITETGAPTGGTFALGVFTAAGGSASIASVAQAASAATLQADLVALPNIGAGGATVSGSNGGPWTITWAAGIAPVVTLTGNSLTGGTSPSVSITQSTSKFGVIQNYLTNAAVFEVKFTAANRRLS